MAGNHERERDLLVLPCHPSPHKVLHHSCVLVLPTTVVMHGLLSQPMVYKEVVEHADDGVRALPHVDSFINQVRHLSGNGLTAYSKDSTLPWSEKVQWAGLKGVVRGKHLLCHVKTVVGCDGSRVWWSL